MNDFSGINAEIRSEETEELSLDAPQGKQLINWEPLAEKIMALGENKCIRLQRALDMSLINSLRHYIESRFRHRIITRRVPGQTYIWKGKAL